MRKWKLLKENETFFVYYFWFNFIRILNSGNNKSKLHIIIAIALYFDLINYCIIWLFKSHGIFEMYLLFFLMVHIPEWSFPPKTISWKLKSRIYFPSDLFLEYGFPNHNFSKYIFMKLKSWIYFLFHEN